MNKYIENLVDSFVKSKDELKKLEDISILIEKKIRDKKGRVFLLGAGQTGQMILNLIETFNYLFKFDKYSLIPIVAGLNQNFTDDSNWRKIESERSIAAIDVTEYEISENDLVINFTSTESTPYNISFLKTAFDLSAITIVISSSKKIGDSSKYATNYIHIPLVGESIENLYIGNYTTILKVAMEKVLFHVFEINGQIINGNICTTKVWTKRLREITFEVAKKFNDDLTFEHYCKILIDAENELSIALIMLNKNIDSIEAKKLVEKNKYNLTSFLN